MNVLLVSGRYDTPDEHHERDRAFAVDLVASGCDVRWLVPLPGGAKPPAESKGVRRCIIECGLPGFAAVENRLMDPDVERAISASIRAELPDAVHLLAYGGSTSVNVSWVANRLGVPVVVDFVSGLVLCHRGDFVDGAGQACGEWNDPDRCAACCLRPESRGPARPVTLLARCLHAIRWPLNPYPTPLAFENRSELLLGGLQFVERVRVRSARDADLAVELGVRRDQLVEVLDDVSVEDWLSVYRGLSG